MRPLADNIKIIQGIHHYENDTTGKIKYILYNPWAVQTPGMNSFGNLSMKLAYKVIGKPISKAVIPITELLDNPPMTALSAYRERKKLSLGLKTYNNESAGKFYTLMTQLLSDINSN
jgi:hypothetical protein